MVDLMIRIQEGTSSDMTLIYQDQIIGLINEQHNKY